MICRLRFCSPQPYSTPIQLKESYKLGNESRPCHVSAVFILPLMRVQLLVHYQPRRSPDTVPDPFHRINQCCMAQTDRIFPSPGLGIQSLSLRRDQLSAMHPMSGAYQRPNFPKSISVTRGSALYETHFPPVGPKIRHRSLRGDHM